MFIEAPLAVPVAAGEDDDVVLTTLVDEAGVVLDDGVKLEYAKYPAPAATMIIITTITTAALLAIDIFPRLICFK